MTVGPQPRRVVTQVGIKASALSKRHQKETDDE